MPVLKTTTIAELKKKARLDSRRYSYEYGLRRSVAGANTYTGNALLWHPEADLFDTPLFSGPLTLEGDKCLFGLTLVDLYIYSRGYDSSLVGNVWLLMSGAGEYIAHDNDYNRIMREVDKAVEREKVRAERYAKMLDAAIKYRELANAPRYANKRKRMPLDVLADWAQDHDDEPAAELLREAHAMKLDV